MLEVLEVLDVLDLLFDNSKILIIYVTPFNIKNGIKILQLDLHVDKFQFVEDLTLLYLYQNIMLITSVSIFKKIDACF